MALIVLECPECYGTQWKMSNHDLHEHLCTNCNVWFKEEDLTLCFVDAELEDED